MERLPEAAYFTLVPDWVCEVISPSTARLDRTKKLHVYARNGVSHCWIVDPILRTLDVMWLESGRWTLASTQSDDEIVRPEPFVAVDLELALLWEGSPQVHS
jgi:Uma2 family endonuclease